MGSGSERGRRVRSPVPTSGFPTRHSQQDLLPTRGRQAALEDCPGEGQLGSPGQRGRDANAGCCSPGSQTRKDRFPPTAERSEGSGDVLSGLWLARQEFVSLGA